MVTAASGGVALTRAVETEFALIILDVMMPGMDGFETLERLKRIPSLDRTPVMLLSAHDPEPRAIEHAYAAGAADCLVKPIAPDVLRAKIQVFVALYNRGQELRRRETALAAKDRHIAILAHDLRAPLAAVAMTAELLRRKLQATHPERLVDRILLNTKRVDLMIRDLLDFARIGAAGLPIAARPMDLAELCRSLVTDLSSARRPRDGCNPGARAQSGS